MPRFRFREIARKLAEDPAGQPTGAEDPAGQPTGAEDPAGQPTGAEGGETGTAARLALSGGGGALGGLLIGWLMGHTKEQMVKDAALFGMAGMGVSEGLYRYARKRDNEPASKIKEFFQKITPAKGGAVQRTLDAATSKIPGISKIPVVNRIPIVRTTNWTDLVGLVTAATGRRSPPLTSANRAAVTALTAQTIDKGLAKAQSLAYRELGEHAVNAYLRGSRNSGAKRRLEALAKKTPDPAAFMKLMETAQKIHKAKTSNSPVNWTGENLLRLAGAADPNFPKEVRSLAGKLNRTTPADAQAYIKNNPALAAALKQQGPAAPGVPDSAFSVGKGDHQLISDAIAAGVPKKQFGYWQKGGAPTGWFAKLKRGLGIDAPVGAYAAPGTIRGFGAANDPTAGRIERLAGRVRRNPGRVGIGISLLGRVYQLGKNQWGWGDTSDTI